MSAIIKEFKSFLGKYKALWLIPLLLLLILATLFVAFSKGRVHTPFIYSNF